MFTYGYAHGNISISPNILEQGPAGRIISHDGGHDTINIHRSFKLQPMPSSDLNHAETHALHKTYCSGIHLAISQLGRQSQESGLKMAGRITESIAIYIIRALYNLCLYVDVLYHTRIYTIRVWYIPYTYTHMV